MYNFKLNKMAQRENKFNLTFNKYKIYDEYKDNIYLFQQFYIPKDDKRKKEINECLKKNIKLKSITKVVLLNERIYTIDELGITENENKKVEQIVIKIRLKYKIFFEVAQRFTGYLLLANSDIYFDETLVNIYKSPLYNERSCYAQLRIEHNKKLFGPRSDSQDAWLFHSKHLQLNTQHSDFELGMPGCDNKITIILAMNNYKLYNEPYRIKINHLHTSNIRGYTGKDVIPGPYLMVLPFLSIKNYETKNLNSIEVKNFIKDKINSNKKIYIPILNLINIKVCYSNLFSLKIQKDWKELFQLSKIAFDNLQSYQLFLTMYNESINNPDILINYENSITNKEEALKYNRDICTVKYTFNRDEINIKNINEYFLSEIKSKKILIIYENIDQFKSKYNKKLFTDCDLVYIQTNIKHTAWFNNYITICKALKNFEDKFDIALIDCYGYSNLIAYYIYNNMNKSAISLENNLKNLLDK
tara:strand:+ start:704 stop:2122 length:1419 start_codon:yes stop_codon:yes gene_type:complete